MAAHIDWQRIADDLDTACRLRGCSLRRVARAIGIASSGLSRLRQGKALSADSLAALVWWLYPANKPEWITNAPPASTERNTQ